MTKSKRLKSFTAAIVGLIMLISLTLCGLSGISAYAATAVNVDLNKTYQEFDGWGLSLSWWATEIGDWDRIGSSGKEKREELMEALYGESGLELNIARYNIGGGDNPTHTHLTDDRGTPGWRGATKMEDDEGNKYYLPDENYVWVDERGRTLSWDKTPDYRQLWVLNWIQEYYREHNKELKTEFYSNSPPYWMNITECASGGNGGGSNLVDDSYHNEAFVRYFLDVYEYLTSQGFEFQNLQPFNESHDYSWAVNGDQEGCHFDSAQKAHILKILAEEMERRGIDAVYNFGDEENTGSAVTAYNQVSNIDKSVIEGASRFTYHIYGNQDNQMRELFRNAHNNGQELYMSEICWKGEVGYDAEATAAGFQYTDSMVRCIKRGGVDAFVYWQGIEDMLGQMKSGTNYGLIQGVYVGQDEGLKQGYNLASMGLNYQDYVLAKAYYMCGQYTKYIKQGYRIVETGDENTVGAISPDGKTLVLVYQNNGGANTLNVNINGFKARSATKIYTDETHKWETSDISVGEGAFNDNVTAKSITTYVITGIRTQGDGYVIDDTDVTTLANLAAIEKAFDEGGETAQAYGTYDKSNCDIKSNGTGNGNYVFGSVSKSSKANDYMAFRFYGVGFKVAFPQVTLGAGKIDISVDGAPYEKAFDCNANSDYTVKNLTKGWHTVYLRSGRGTIGSSVNFDAVFVYTEGDRNEVDDVYITGVYGAGDKVAVTYGIEGYDDCELYAEYRTNNVDWTRETAPLDGGKGTITVPAGTTTAQVRIAVVNGEETVYTTNYKQTDVASTQKGILYFVDCGTNGNKARTGGVIGEYQCVPDKEYSLDPVSGLYWGYEGELVTAGEKGYYESYEPMTSVASGAKFESGEVSYKFTIPTPGNYKVAVGFFGGGNGWGSRKETVTVSGNAPKDVEFDEMHYIAEYFTITTRARNERVTVKVAKASGETQEALVSTIVISEAGTAIPLYTSTPSNYNVYGTVSTDVGIGETLQTKLEETGVVVYMTDGNTVSKRASDLENKIAYNGDSAARVTVEFPEFEGLNAHLDFILKQSGARVLYYNIDCGTSSNPAPDDVLGLIGTKQTTTHDQEYNSDPGTRLNTSWGYTGGSNGAYNTSGDAKNSIREGNGSRVLTYKMNGFAENENLHVEVAGHCQDWTSRNMTVKANGGTGHALNLVKGDGGYNYKSVEFDCTANASGELEIVITSTTSGQGPLVSYIKVWSTGTDAVLNAIEADKTAISSTDELTLSNLVAGATVNMFDDANSLLYSFVAESDTYTFVPGAYLNGDSFGLRFVQLSADAGASEPLTIAMPGVVYSVQEGYVRDGDYAVITFVPQGAEDGVTSLTLITTDGVRVDLMNGYYYHARYNGEYAVEIVSHGVKITKKFTVNNIDTVEYNPVFSTTDITNKDVTLTLTPVSKSGDILEMYVNDELVELSGGKYAITATENSEYDVKVVTAAGFVYNKVFEINNIDKTDAKVDLGIDFTSGGVSLKYEENGTGGGSLGVQFNGGAVKAVTDSELVDLTQAGKYTFVYTNGAGEVAAEKVYYVGYGASSAKLGNVTVKGNKVSVSGCDSYSLYRAGDATEVDSAAKAGKYYLQLNKGDDTEIIVLNFAPSVKKIESLNKSGTNGVGGMVAGILIGVLAIAAAATVCTLMILKKRKAAKAEAGNKTETAENGENAEAENAEEGAENDENK